MSETYFTIDQIKAAAAESDHSRFWFTPATMRFFRSRVLPGVIGGHYFITSEQGPHQDRRYYTVRSCFDGAIDTVGEFQGYRTAEGARNAARRLVAAR